MSKTLSTVLTVFKIARIVAKVIFILCIVGGAGCLAALLLLPMASGVVDLLADGELSLTLASAYPACIVGIVSFAGEGVLAFLAERYFRNVLSACTPFTLDGSKECFRLGIASLIVSVAVSVLSGIVVGIFLLLAMDASELDSNVSVSLSTGLFFLFLSLIFKHGAELQAPAAEEPAEEPAQEPARETTASETETL